MATFGILVGGGPAPGINGVIGAATILAKESGARVYGIPEGFRWLMEGRTDHARDLQISDVSRIHLAGGSFLFTSRANPTKKEGDLERVVAALRELEIDHLITIGGDDTAYSARRVSEAAGGSIHVAHVPKTIDNDLPLPEGIPTFGFETARENAAQTLANLLEDALTTRRWYFAVLMGRSAGHLAQGAAKAASATVTLIPEEFPETIRLEQVTRVLEGSIVKRLASGQPYGLAVISEGVGMQLAPDSLAELENVERDEHGHIRLAEVPLGRVLQHAVRDGLAELGVKMTIVDKDVGYELRCAPPCAFDLDYTRDLGAGAVRTLLAGGSGVMITRQHAGEIVPIPFEEIVDPSSGKTQVRRVNVGSEGYKSARSLQVRIEREDLEDPKTLEALAGVLGLTPDQTRERYASTV